jgi:RNA polymerase subunit RPABC4/transcription elongation factor Spt4
MEPPEPADDSWFGIDCPACAADLAANKEDVGTLAVCPYCRATLIVPNWGYHLKDAGPPSVAHSQDPLHHIKEVRCLQCHTLIPASSEICPYCGRQNPVPPLNPEG